MLLVLISIANWTEAVTADNTEIQTTTQIEGLDKDSLENVQTRLDTDINDLTKPLTADTLTSFYDQSNQAVAKGLTPFGYFSPEIQKNLVAQTPKHWILNYRIATGLPSRITVVDIRLTGAGENAAELQRLRRTPPFHLSQIFLSQSYDDYKEQLIATANTLGYIDAAFSEHRVLVNRLEHTVEIHLVLDTGNNFYFGPVSFQKNPLSNTFLQRFVPFKTGQSFTPGLSDQLQSNLNNSGYFQQVEVLPRPSKNPPDPNVPIQVNIIPKPRQQYTFGGGYGTDTGPRVSVGSNWNYVTDTGHQLSMLARLSQVQSTFVSKYLIPGANPLEDQYNVNASLLTNNITQGSSQTRQLGAGFSHSHDGWQRTLNLSYQIEHYSFNSDPYQTSHLLLPSLGYQKTVSDNPLFPTKANNFSFLIQGAKEGVFADTNLIQGRLQEKWLCPITEKSRFLLRTDLGYTAIKNANLLPLSLSFFTGGAQSVRGYGYNVLGPGRYLVVLSAEYRHDIVKDWYGATFIDMGNAFDNLPSGGTGGIESKSSAIYRMLQRGVGLGVGWNSPVGPMQLSLAKAVNAPGMPNRIQFNMGTAF